MTNRSSSSDLDTSDDCPRCGGPLPHVHYGYPNFEALMKLKSRGVAPPVLGGCVVGKPVLLECPRCGLTGVWSLTRRPLVPLQEPTTE